MERSRSNSSSQTRPQRVERQLAPLKILSRLLGHELHAQQSSRLTLSREEVIEIQTTIDLHIDNMSRGRAGGSGSSAQPAMVGELEVQAVPARVN